MAALRKKLIEKLEEIPGVEVRLWKPDYHLMVVNFKTKEVAHFHGNNEIDIRLSTEFIKTEGLKHAENRIGHPDRKAGSRWLIARFTRETHLPGIERLVKAAIDLR